MKQTPLYFWPLLGLLAGIPLLGFSQPIGLKYLGAGQGGTNAEALRVKLAGTQVAVATGANGLQVFDAGNPANPLFLGEMRTSLWGNLFAMDVDRNGDLAYVAAARDGLEIVDLKDPRHPVRAGGYRSGGSARAVVVSGNYAYVAAEEAGLYVLNVANASFVDMAGHFPNSLADTLVAWDVQISGPYAYVAGASDGLVILRIDYPDMILRLGSLALGGNATEVAISGSTACVLSDNGQLCLIDVTNPRSPTLLSKYPASPNQLKITGLVSDGSRVYLAADTNGVQVIDISNPASPALAGQIGTFGPAEGIGLSGGIIAAANGFAGFTLLQPVANATALPAISTQPLDQSVLKGATIQFQVAATAASPLSYQWLFNGLPLRNATNSLLTMTNVTSVNAGAYAVVVTTGSGSVLSRQATLEVQKVIVPLPVIVDQPGDQMILPGTTAQFKVVATGTEPLSYQWFFETTAIPNATNNNLNIPSAQSPQAGYYTVVVSNEGGSVTSRAARLSLALPPVLVAQPADHTVLESNSFTFWSAAQPVDAVEYQWFWNGQPIPGATRQSLSLQSVTLQQAGRYSVIASNLAGVVVSTNATLTVRPRVNLESVAHWPPGANALSVDDVAIVGTTAYVSCGLDGVFILDITNPTAPAQRGFIASRGYSSHVCFQNNLLYIADGLNGGLQIVDVTNPSNPIRKSSYKSNTSINDVKVLNARAYLAGGSAGLILLDVSNPAQPAFLGSKQGWEAALRVDATGDYAYTAEGIGGFGVFDVRVPTAPQEVKRIEDYDFSAKDVRVVGNWLYVATAYDGMEVRNISNPANPVFTSFDTTGFGLSLTVKSNYVFMASDDEGLTVIDATDLENVIYAGSYATTPGSAYGVDVLGEYVFVAGGSSGLLILKASRNQLPSANFSIATQWDPGAQEIRLLVPSAGRGPVVLEATTDLKQWSRVQTNSQPPVNGQVEFRRAPKAGKASEFFRAVTE